MERLQKFLSTAGVSSRRQAERLMLEGRVTVNGQVCKTLGVKIDPAHDAVKVDGKLVHATQRFVYVLLNKPKGTICTMDDPENRPKVVDLVRGLKLRVYPVGRLDFDTSGALLLTNDGELANLLMHPKHLFPKTYVAKVKGIPGEDVLEKLRRGIYIEGGRTAPAEARLVAVKEKNSLVELVLREGRNKQVKRMFLAVGHSVLRLERRAFGFLTCDGLLPGQWRLLEAPEIARLKEGATAQAGEAAHAPVRRPEKPVRVPQRSERPERSERPVRTAVPKARRSVKGPAERSDAPRARKPRVRNEGGTASKPAPRKRARREPTA